MTWMSLLQSLASGFAVGKSEVQDSSLRACCFPHSFQANYMLFPIYYSLITLSLDTLQSELLTVSINEPWVAVVAIVM
jgi:hypothetical protein